MAKRWIVLQFDTATVNVAGPADAFYNYLENELINADVCVTIAEFCGSPLNKKAAKFIKDLK